MTRRKRRPLLMDDARVVGRRSVPHVVYAFRFPSRPWALKIGYSSRGLERIREQTTGYPEAPEVVLVFHHRHAKTIERSLHTALSGQQMHGTVGTEWFRATLDDLVSASPDLRAAMGRQLWRSRARWWVALVGLALWAVCLPMWFALFEPDRGGALATLVAAWREAPWTVVSSALAAIASLPSGGPSLDAIVPALVVLAAWLWWVVLRR